MSDLDVRKAVDIVALNRSYSKIPIFNATGFDQPICRYAFPLISNHEQRWHVMGTAVMIAPGLGMTAAHVVEACFAEYRGMRFDPAGLADLTAGFGMMAVQFLNSTSGVIWRIDKIHVSGLTDVAYLQMVPDRQPPADVLQRMSINLVPPEAGSRVAAFGYPLGSAVEGAAIEIRLSPRTSVGEVAEVHAEARDAWLRFPCFRTNARFDPGMSGGPVFDEAGRLCGLICSNLPPDDPDGEHTSYVTLLWPSMAVPISAPRAGRPADETYPVLELARDRVLEVAGWERVVLEDERTVAWRR